MKRQTLTSKVIKMKNLQVKSNEQNSVEVVNVSIDSIVDGLSSRKQPRMNSQGDIQRLGNRYAVGLHSYLNSLSIADAALVVKSLLVEVMKGQDADEQERNKVLQSNSVGFKGKSDAKAASKSLDSSMNDKEVLEYWLSLCNSGHSKLSRYWRQFQHAMLEVCGFELDKNMSEKMYEKFLKIENKSQLHGYFVN